MAQHMIIKVAFQGEMKRLPVSSSIIFVELNNKLKSLFSIQQNVIMKYLDDENDLITLTNEDEMREAVRLAQRNNLVVRIHLFTSDQQNVAVEFNIKPKNLTNESTTIPSLLSSQLPLMAADSLGASPATPMVVPVNEKERQKEKLPVVEEKPVLPNGYVTINQRTAQLSEQTATRCSQLAEEISNKTAKTCEEITKKCTKLSQNIPTPSERIDNNCAALAERTVACCDSLSNATSAKCNFLADSISSKTEEYSKIGASLDAHTGELGKRWATLADDTTARMNALSAAITQKLLAL